MKKLFTVLIILIVLSMLSVFGAYTFTSKFLSVIQPGSLTETASYVIFTDGTNYYSKNGMTGEIDTGTASEVIRNALQTGKFIMVKKGNYYLTNPISILNDDTIFSGEGGETKFYYNGNDAAIKIGDASHHVFMVQLRDFSLTGSKSPATQNGIHAYETHFGKFENLEIYDFGGAGILFERSWTNEVFGCDIRGSLGGGIKMIGIKDHQSNDITIRKNYICGNSPNIDISGYSPQNIVIEQNVLADSSYSIIVHEGENLKIIDNYFEIHDVYDIWLRGDVNTIQGVKIERNWFPLVSTTHRGIYSENVNYVYIGKNSVRLAFDVGPGIFVESTAASNNLRFDFNDIFGNIQEWVHP